MFEVGNKIVDERIPFIKFSCDLETCKGACCTVKGGKGAPLQDFEIFEIQNCIPELYEILPEKNIQILKANNGIESYPDGYTTACIDDKDCVFVYYENNIAKCAFEKAYNEGKITFYKPLSCHLFPIRISNFGGDILRFEKFSECKSAILKGENKNIPLYIFLKNALIRYYGKEWYQDFKRECEKRSKMKEIIET